MLARVARVRCERTLSTLPSRLTPVATVLEPAAVAAPACTGRNQR